MRRLLISLTAAICALTGSALAASDYPTKPVRILVPYGPGGATDIATRIIADGLQKQLGQPMVVENKPGGSGVVALQELVRAEPDGYTLLVGNVTTNMINPILKAKEFPFDYFKEIAPITRLVQIPHVFLASKNNFPPDTVPEVIEYAKKHSGELNHVSSGYLAYTHIDFLMLQDKTGIKMNLIPLRAGAGGGQVALMNGEAQLGIQNIATTLPLVKSGKLKAIAVTSDERLADLPDVPTMKELGYEGIGTNAWQGMFIRAGTADEVVAKIHSAVIAALKDPDVKQRLEKLHYDIVPLASAAEAKAWMQKEKDRWEPIAAKAQQLAEKQK